MLDLLIEGTKGTKPLQFEVKLHINGGFASRDQVAALRTLDEMKKEGIDIPVRRTPIFWPKMTNRITTSNVIEVLAGSKSCGEVEPVILLGKGKEKEIYIAVGSDHSDRELEKYDMVISKQMYPNVISRKVWRYEDVKRNWDDLVLRAWTIAADGKRTLYQEAKMNSLMTVEDFLEKAKEHIHGDIAGAVILMGTIPTLGGKLVFTPGFEGELADERAKRKLTCAYTIAPIAWFKGEVF